MPANGLVGRRRAWGGSISSGRLSRLGVAALLFLMLPAAASAYTLVLRNGRHVTLPDDFKVTPAAVIYEASPGFSVTVWLSNVDVAATERANAEPAGSFAARIVRGREGAGASRAGAAEAAQAGRRPGRKVVTNKDLEPSRLRRESQEAEYERTRRERGMPSKEEVRRRVEEEDSRLREWARQMREARREAEVESLRYELLNVRRDLSELSLHLSRQAAGRANAYAPPDYYPYFYAPPAPVLTVFPLGHFGSFGRGGSRPHPHGAPWTHHARPVQPFPPFVGRPRGDAYPPRAPIPRTPATRR